MKTNPHVKHADLVAFSRIKAEMHKHQRGHPLVNWIINAVNQGLLPVPGIDEDHLDSHPYISFTGMTNHIGSAKEVFTISFDVDAYDEEHDDRIVTNRSYILPISLLDKPTKGAFEQWARQQRIKHADDLRAQVMELNDRVIRAKRAI